MIGFDTASTLSDATLRRAAAKGVGFVCIYLKYLSVDLVARVFAHGLAIVVIFETTAERALTGAPGGVADGRAARAHAAALGIPMNTAIYATADFGETADQDGAVAAYFSAFKAALGGMYRLGVYAEGAVCQLALDKGITALPWLAGGRSMRGTALFAAQGRAAIVQDVGDAKRLRLGIAIDTDTALVDDFGQWAAAASTVAEQKPAALEIPSARDLQAALAAIGLYKGAIDGEFGPLSCAALQAYYRQ